MLWVLYLLTCIFPLQKCSFKHKCCEENNCGIECSVPLDRNRTFWVWRTQNWGNFFNKWVTRNYKRRDHFIQSLIFIYLQLCKITLCRLQEVQCHYPTKFYVRRVFSLQPCSKPLEPGRRCCLWVCSQALPFLGLIEYFQPVWGFWGGLGYVLLFQPVHSWPHCKLLVESSSGLFASIFQLYQHLFECMDHHA